MARNHGVHARLGKAVSFRPYRSHSKGSEFENHGLQRVLFEADKSTPTNMGSSRVGWNSQSLQGTFTLLILASRYLNTY